jgi:hypothetical protein
MVDPHRPQAAPEYAECQHERIGRQVQHGLDGAAPLLRFAQGAIGHVVEPHDRAGVRPKPELHKPVRSRVRVQADRRTRFPAN